MIHRYCFLLRMVWWDWKSSNCFWHYSLVSTKMERHGVQTHGGYQKCLVNHWMYGGFRFWVQCRVSNVQTLSIFSTYIYYNILYIYNIYILFVWTFSRSFNFLTRWRVVILGNDSNILHLLKAITTKYLHINLTCLMSFFYNNNIM